MDLSEKSFQRFIELTYDAVEDHGRWRLLYDQLQQATGVTSIHMLGLDKRHGTLSYSDGANMPVDGELAYMQRYRLMDPRMPAMLESPVGTWVHCHEVVSEDLVRSHPFYQEFLLPYDRRYMSGTRLVDTPEATVVFATLSSSSQGPLSPAQLEFLDRLKPHLQRACRISLQSFVYSTQALVGQMLVNKLRQPVILMSPSGDVMHTNEAAQELLRATRLVSISEGRLQLPKPQLSELLGQCAQMEQTLKAAQAIDMPDESFGIPESLQSPGPSDTSRFRALLITQSGTPARPAGDTLYAFYSMLAPKDMLGTFGLRPAVMLLFYYPASAPAIDSGLLYAIFGLSPAECRIATLLAEGLSLKQIADMQGTQHETVRKQLRSIYQKTDTNRQPDLVRLLLHLPHNAIQD